jgi:hypothetical protein
VDSRILLVGVERESSRGLYFLAQLLSLVFCMVFALQGHSLRIFVFGNRGVLDS